MGIFDEIEVAAIAIDETTILEIKATVKVWRAIMQKKYACPKVCCTLHQSFYFNFFFLLIQPVPLLFSRCRRFCDCSNLLVALTLARNHSCATI